MGLKMHIHIFRLIELLYCYHVLLRPTFVCLWMVNLVCLWMVTHVFLWMNTLVFLWIVTLAFLWMVTLVP